ncbi:hypothetical protein L6164_027323 [Bauhinia variegata]|uniref:Uncharacterized protein n=1 Tax=Bauhinia variegata TaxID=167791 RepID=A0ACB9LSY2_BAUVA|nr:hypothetical protein L6164_027323 [Bauhinia variegata]
MDAGGTRRQPGSDPEALLNLCRLLLDKRDFSSCRQRACQVPRSDPVVSDTVNRVLAVANVLLAAERRICKDHLDWYAILQLRRADSKNRQLVRDQFKKLMYLLNPNKNGFPFSNEAFMLVRQAWSVLSDSEKRAQYERAFDNASEPCKPSRGKQMGSRKVPENEHNMNAGEQNATFWTVCPYCWTLYEYEKNYEECSLRCQNCRRVFHGAPVDPPAPEEVVSGKDQYYCYHAYLPVRYSAEKVTERKRRKERAMRNKNMGGAEVLSNVSEDIGGQSSGFREGEAGPSGKVRFEVVHEELGNNVGEGVQGNVRHGECERVVQGIVNTGLQSNGKRGMKMKTVARTTKKISGNRFRNEGFKPQHWQEELSDSDEEYEIEIPNL